MSMRFLSSSARAAIPACLAALLLGFTGASAGAKTVEEDYDRCLSQQQDTTNGEIAERMAACTHVITTPDADEDSLAYAYYARGGSYGRLDDLQRALADYTQSIAHNPKLAEPYAMRAQIRLLLGQMDDGLRDANQALAIDPKNFPAHSARLDVSMARGNYAQALDDTNYIIKNFPQNAANYYYDLAEIYLQLNDMDRALAAAETSVKVAPNSLQSYEERARILFALGRYKDAVPDANILVKSAPQSAEGYLIRGFSQAMLLDFGPALADADTVFALVPGEAQSFQMRCEVRAMANQRIDEALADCNTAFQRDPKQQFFHLWGRGLAYLRKGMNSEALADLDAARREEPKSAIPLYLHGVALARLGKTAEGRAEIAKAQQMDKTNCDALASMGFAG
jgi:tetratricopeptide (TPR) repeat protein